ncbi:MAG: hypothetical protein ACI39R_08540 [Lachnospiraceae bacterium]
MKKIRYLVVAMLIILSMIIFTGCGKNSENTSAKSDGPTQTDVEESLKNGGYIPDDDKTEWSLTIEDCTFDDDEDLAYVDCTLFVKNEPIETTTKFEISFIYKKTKGWDSITIDEQSVNNVLTEGIPDDVAKELLLGDTYYTIIDNELFVHEENITSIEITEHINDFDDFKDSVVAVINAEVDYKILEFTATVEFTYNLEKSSGEGWKIGNITVDPDVKTEYEENYKPSFTEEELIAYLREEDTSYLNFLLQDYYYYDDYDIYNVTIEDYKYDSVYYLTLCCTFKFKVDDMILDVYSEITLQFDGTEWKLEYVNNNKVLAWDSDAVGTWVGTDDEFGEVTIVINSGELNSNDEIDGTVTIQSETKGTYSYQISVWRYEPYTGLITTGFVDWISVPSQDEFYEFRGYSGYVSGNTWKSDMEMFPYTFTKIN